MKRFIILALTIMMLGIGCGPGYWAYRDGEVPGHISHAKVIPIWIDDKFTEGEEESLMWAILEWNRVFNGQMELKY